MRCGMDSYERTSLLCVSQYYSHPQASSKMICANGPVCGERQVSGWSIEQSPERYRLSEYKPASIHTEPHGARAVRSGGHLERV